MRRFDVRKWGFITFLKARAFWPVSEKTAVAFRVLSVILFGREI